MMDLDRRSRVLQVHEALLDLVQAERLGPGEQLPSESELAKRFAVSRGTVREALKLMEQDGMLDVQHGRGRFLSATAGLTVSRPITRFESVTEMLASRGYTLEVRVLSVGIGQPTTQEAAALHLSADEPVVRLERVRLHKGEVVVGSINAFCVSILGDLAVEDVDFSRSLVDWLALQGHGPISSVAEITAEPMPARFVTTEQADENQQWLLVTEYCVDQTGTPVLFSQDYHRGDMFKFHVLRRRKD